MEAKDKTERFILAAKARARAARNEQSPKLTTLEKGMWDAMKRADKPVRRGKAA